MSDKPDGYVGWHPIHGFDFETVSYISEDKAWYYKIYTPAFLFETDKSFEDAMEFNKQNAIQAGWRIRPVKLVFLDDEEVNDKSKV